ncbi:MAG: S46 family peptidase, partial [Roseateles sp.]
LADMTRHPLSAMVSLGGCSGAFVSAEGLVITNHHCAFGAIQRNATAQRNLMAEGFLARSRAEELPAGSTERFYVTDRIDDVTAEVTGGLPATLGGAERHAQIEQRIKALIAACEQDAAYRCTVPSFHRGLSYYRVRQLMIRDVRLVYAPSERIGNYGGEVDNFEWPRHTGDFTFLRAYVGRDGRPADPSPDNVPYRPRDFLTVSTAGLRENDPILLAGYPGRTQRYRLPAEVRAARDVQLPRRVAETQADIAVIRTATAPDPESVVRYASVVRGLANGLKRSQGTLDGLTRRDIAAQKDAQDADFRRWLATQGRSDDLATLRELDAAIADDQLLSNQEFGLGVALHSDLYRSARTLYRLALEQRKPDAEREPGFQQRDLPQIQARLARLEKTSLPTVDAARWQAALQRYAALPAPTHPAGLDALLPAPDEVRARVTGSELADRARREAWLSQPVDAFEASTDPLIRLAVAHQPLLLALEARRKAVDGTLEQLVPRYMQAYIAYRQSRGEPVYPDANGTLRVTFGRVSGYRPHDGLLKLPFTTLEGVLEKHTGQAPFDAPAALREAAAAQRGSPYRDAVLGTVPVNFLSTADTTGGNSGSAVMNRRGELVGLNFDSTYEAIAKDWAFDPAMTRAIHVDIRYALWVMQQVDHADAVLRELTIRGTH